MIFLIEDNGYAISVPVEVQTAGGDVSRLVESFPNLKIWRCDGTDFVESYRTLGEAVEWVRRERKPAFVHAKVIRPYSHSLSDDERLYKTPDEREAEALGEGGVDEDGGALEGQREVAVAHEAQDLDARGVDSGGSGDRGHVDLAPALRPGDHERQVAGGGQRERRALVPFVV